MNAFRITPFLLLLLLLGCGESASERTAPPGKPTPEVPGKAIPEYGFKVVNSFPHDPKAFTQGLVFENGFLYESTGQYGQSSLRKVELETGRVLQKLDLDKEFFGEGMAIWKDEIVQLTYQNEIGLVYDRATFQQRRQFRYPGEGWGLTNNDEHLILSNGTSALWFLDPKTYEVVRRLEVKANGQAVQDLNELEWVEGEIYANIWYKEVIARIDPHSGQVVGWINLAGLYQAGQARADNDVLNGIAYDAQARRLFVTGKNWPRLYEIRLVPK